MDKVERTITEINPFPHGEDGAQDAWDLAQRPGLSATYYKY